MKQETLNQTNNEFDSISFQQKSTILSLVITIGTTAYYIANMWLMRPIALATDSIPAGFGGLILTSVGLIILAQIIMQAVLAFGSGSTPAATAHERLAALKATRIGSGVMMFGVLAAVGSVFFQEPTAFWTANLAFLGLLFAEIIKYIAQLYYAR